MERTAVTLPSPTADGGVAAARADTDLAVGQIYTLDVHDTLSLQAGAVIFTMGDGSDGQTIIGSAVAGDFAIDGSGVVGLVGQSGTVNAAIPPDARATHVLTR